MSSLNLLFSAWEGDWWFSHLGVRWGRKGTRASQLWCWALRPNPGALYLSHWSSGFQVVCAQSSNRHWFEALLQNGCHYQGYCLWGNDLLFFLQLHSLVWFVSLSLVKRKYGFCCNLLKVNIISGRYYRGEHSLSLLFCFALFQTQTLKTEFHSIEFHKCPQIFCDFSLKQ